MNERLNSLGSKGSDDYTNDGDLTARLPAPLQNLTDPANVLINNNKQQFASVGTGQQYYMGNQSVGT